VKGKQRSGRKDGIARAMKRTTHTRLARRHRVDCFNSPCILYLGELACIYTGMYLGELKQQHAYSAGGELGKLGGKGLGGGGDGERVYTAARRKGGNAGGKRCKT
jgi:hypothetical protein